tara:strand:- start:3719 stop:4333 length:615 start_codon:yes stop_codon:yes gene_type:complete
MKKIITLLGCVFLLICFSNCQQNVKPTHDDETSTENKVKAEFGNFESQIKYGEHLVTILDCNVCHTPKKMTDQGPVLDLSLLLSGRPMEIPLVDIDRLEMESKGLIITRDLTEWIGPWGVSFAANLTPDETGIGNWTEEQFFLAIRKGKYKGLQESRTLLPPMPWQSFSFMTDSEIKAIFAYLKSIKPIHNIVPSSIPPISAGK